MTAQYPREPDAHEREVLEWVLPADRPGYRGVREAIAGMAVIGEGRRGPGEFILGRRGDAVDLGSPLGAVFAYGAIETDAGLISVTLREITDGQMSVEIVSHRGEEVPALFTERRRWTYSSWDPGAPCPQCLGAVREVAMHPEAGGNAGRTIVLAVCAGDRRLWVHDTAACVNRLIPVTNFYNELMLRKHIRDPKTALDASLLFTSPGRWSDDDLAGAFAGYNALREKVEGAAGIVPDPPAPRRSLGGFFRSLIRKPS